SPRVAQQFLRANLVHSGEFVAQPVQRFSQRSSPFLLPLPIRPGVAATIALPPCNPVHTTPGCVLQDFNFLRRGMLSKILAVIRDSRQFVLFDVVESIREGHVAARVMVSVRLAVSSDVDQLRRITNYGEYFAQ